MCSKKWKCPFIIINNAKECSRELVLDPVSSSIKDLYVLEESLAKTHAKETGADPLFVRSMGYLSWQVSYHGVLAVVSKTSLGSMSKFLTMKNGFKTNYLGTIK